jgi:hypothetical protein
MNRAALGHLQSAIDSNMLAELFGIWRETHDIFQGLLLWLYDIETYSLLRNLFKPYAVYYEEFIRAQHGLIDFNTSDFIILHQVPLKDITSHFTCSPMAFSKFH